MKNLGIRTDGPLAEFYLFKNKEMIAEASWQADRQLARQLLGRLEQFLHENDTSFDTLDGLFVYQGPGSFTGLRIGITVMNTAAYALEIPIVGAETEEWRALCLRRLLAGENDEIVLPHYGAEARITKPRK